MMNHFIFLVRDVEFLFFTEVVQYVVKSGVCWDDAKGQKCLIFV